MKYSTSNHIKVKAKTIVAVVAHILADVPDVETKVSNIDNTVPYFDIEVRNSLLLFEKTCTRCGTSTKEYATPTSLFDYVLRLFFAILKNNLTFLVKYPDFF